jgi:hypothetical protein
MQNVLATKKGRKNAKVPPRLFVLFARKAAKAVIFRRGPSHWVQLILWNTELDEFESGQWFHGRIYERRSDLSPDGSLLIYFAQKINSRTLGDSEYTYAWTAVSKPPFLTALALWPKGDCWHGGGLFQSNSIVELNHKPEVAHFHPKHEPKGLTIKLRSNVHGEDDPLYSARLERDGWRLQRKWEVHYRGYPLMYETTSSELRTKLAPDPNRTIQLERSIDVLNYSEAFNVIDRERALSVPILGASWVDWDQRGRLIIAREGKIIVGQLSPEGVVVERELIDLSDSKPTLVPPPPSAVSW